MLCDYWWIISFQLFMCTFHSGQLPYHEDQSLHRFCWKCPECCVPSGCNYVHDSIQVNFCFMFKYFKSSLLNNLVLETLRPLRSSFCHVATANAKSRFEAVMSVTLLRWHTSLSTCHLKAVSPLSGLTETLKDVCKVPVQMPLVV